MLLSKLSQSFSVVVNLIYKGYNCCRQRIVWINGVHLSGAPVACSNALTEEGLAVRQQYVHGSASGASICLEQCGTVARPGDAVIRSAQVKRQVGTAIES